MAKKETPFRGHKRMNGTDNPKAKKPPSGKGNTGHTPVKHNTAWYNRQAEKGKQKTTKNPKSRKGADPKLKKAFKLDAPSLRDTKRADKTVKEYQKKHPKLKKPNIGDRVRATKKFKLDQKSLADRHLKDIDIGKTEKALDSKDSLERSRKATNRKLVRQGKKVIPKQPYSPKPKKPRTKAQMKSDRAADQRKIDKRIKDSKNAKWKKGTEAAKKHAKKTMTKKTMTKKSKVKTPNIERKINKMVRATADFPAGPEGRGHVWADEYEKREFAKKSPAEKAKFKKARAAGKARYDKEMSKAKKKPFAIKDGGKSKPAKKDARSTKVKKIKSGLKTAGKVIKGAAKGAARGMSKGATGAAVGGLLGAATASGAKKRTKQEQKMMKGASNVLANRYKKQTGKSTKRYTQMTDKGLKR
jgi:hypothetical protein